MNNYFSSVTTRVRYKKHECLGCRAELLIYPGEMHPSEVTKLLGIKPTTENVAGTTDTSALGRVRQIKISGWFLSSDQEVNSLELSDHVDWLLEKVTPVVDQVLALQRLEDVAMRWVFIWWAETGCGGPILRPEQLRALAKFGLECPLTVCYYGETK